MPLPGVANQARFPDPLEGGEVQSVWVHLSQHVLAVTSQDYEFFMACLRGLPNLQGSMSGSCQGFECCSSYSVSMVVDMHACVRMALFQSIFNF